MVLSHSVQSSGLKEWLTSYRRRVCHPSKYGEVSDRQRPKASAASVGAQLLTCNRDNQPSELEAYTSAYINPFELELTPHLSFPFTPHSFAYSLQLRPPVILHVPCSPHSHHLCAHRSGPTCGLYLFYTCIIVIHHMHHRSSVIANVYALRSQLCKATSYYIKLNVDGLYCPV